MTPVIKYEITWNSALKNHVHSEYLIKWYDAYVHVKRK